jgi:hypothetical protein
MSRPGKTIVIVLLVACAVIFLAIVWTAIATDKDSGNSAPELTSEHVGDQWGQYGKPWPAELSSISDLGGAAVQAS